MHEQTPMPATILIKVDVLFMYTRIPKLKSGCYNVRGHRLSGHGSTDFETGVLQVPQPLLRVHEAFPGALVLW
jgi:hypothetical protein